jgi:hypothetical protein
VRCIWPGIPKASCEQNAARAVFASKFGHHSFGNNKTDVLFRAKKVHDPKQNKGLQILFFGSTRSLRMHISRFQDHYEAYLGYCTDKGITPDSSALPSDATLRKGAAFRDEE